MEVLVRLWRLSLAGVVLKGEELQLAKTLQSDRDSARSPSCYVSRIRAITRVTLPSQVSSAIMLIIWRFSGRQQDAYIDTTLDIAQGRVTSLGANFGACVWRIPPFSTGTITPVEPFTLASIISLLSLLSMPVYGTLRKRSPKMIRPYENTMANIVP